MTFSADFPHLTSWVKIPHGCDFPIQNLPFGVFKTKDSYPRVGVAIGDSILDLDLIHRHGLLDNLGLPPSIFNKADINEFIALGNRKTSVIRNRVGELLLSENDELRANEPLVNQALVNQNDAEMLMPVSVGDYTDFYSSKEHASNVGRMFRGEKNALPPNWLHMPIAYHGRSSSIIGTNNPVYRPYGQLLKEGSVQYGPSEKLDFELEMAFITNSKTNLGDSIKVEEAMDSIFGMTIFNDWSARDIQKWEYVPLGPFLGKNFASTISSWVVTLDALDPFKVEGPRQQEILPYLSINGKYNFDIDLQVELITENGDQRILTNSNSKYLYWNVCQQLAHHTVNGCNINPGDVFASGTISGPDRGTEGSLLELTWNGGEPIILKDRAFTFLEDGDTVVMRAWGTRNNVKIGFGEIRNNIKSKTKDN
ncbi:MAG TPA: fumarylacetoacetase [Cyclobacteriaceae bacterium]